MVTRLKIVLDTNVYVSALGWRGNEFHIFRKCVIGELDLYLSNAILLEIERVLSYPRLGFTAEERELFLSLVRRTGRIVVPQEEVPVIAEDPSDDKFLACAIEAGADFLVSGDRHLLRLKTFRHIPILSAGQCISLLKRYEGI